MLINLLYLFGVMNVLITLFSPILSNLFGLPNEAIGALIMGFLRKDLATAMLAPMQLTANQLVVASTVLAVSFPCIATFAVLIKEIGVRDMIKTVSMMLIIALIVGTLLRKYVLPAMEKPP